MVVVCVWGKKEAGKACDGADLRFYPPVVDECSCVCCEATHRNTNVLINLRHLLDARGFLQCIHLVYAAGLTTHGARTSSGDVTRFSTANTTPSLVLMPMAVDPSWNGMWQPHQCTKLILLRTLIASMAYST